MAVRGTLGFVTGRAGTRRSAVAALLVSVLVICTLVTTLITAMGPLTQSALDASTAALPADDTVVEVRTSYDDDDPQAQDAAVRTALAPVNEPLGGELVGRAEGVTYDLIGNARAADSFAFSALTGPRTGSSWRRAGCRNRPPRRAPLPRSPSLRRWLSGSTSRRAIDFGCAAGTTRASCVRPWSASGSRLSLTSGAGWAT